MPRNVQNIGSLEPLPDSPINSSRAARARKMETVSAFEKISRNSGTGTAFMSTMLCQCLPLKASAPCPRKQVI